MPRTTSTGFVTTRDLPVSVSDPAVVSHLDTVLLPIGAPDEDRIDRLAATAAETAGLFQATVRVLHVFRPQRFREALEELGYDTRDPPDPDTIAKRYHPVRDVARELAGPLRKWGTRLTVEGRVGESVATEICTAAADGDAKRIVIGGRRRSPVGKVVFGSTAQDVLLHAPCPVTVVKD